MTTSRPELRHAEGWVGWRQAHRCATSSGSRPLRRGESNTPNTTRARIESSGKIGFSPYGPTIPDAAMTANPAHTQVGAATGRHADGRVARRGAGTRSGRRSAPTRRSRPAAPATTAGGSATTGRSAAAGQPGPAKGDQQGGDPGHRGEVPQEPGHDPRVQHDGDEPPAPAPTSNNLRPTVTNRPSSRA